MIACVRRANATQADAVSALQEVRRNEGKHADGKVPPEATRSILSAMKAPTEQSALAVAAPAAAPTAASSQPTTAAPAAAADAHVATEEVELKDAPQAHSNAVHGDAAPDAQAEAAAPAATAPALTTAAASASNDPSDGAVKSSEAPAATDSTSGKEACRESVEQREASFSSSNQVRRWKLNSEPKATGRTIITSRSQGKPRSKWERATRRVRTGILAHRPLLLEKKITRHIRVALVDDTPKFVFSDHVFRFPMPPAQERQTSEWPGAGAPTSTSMRGLGLDVHTERL